MIKQCRQTMVRGPRRLLYHCTRVAGHEGPCAVALDRSTVSTENETRPRHYKLSFIIGRGTVKIDEEPVDEGLREIKFEVIDVIEALGYQDDAYLTTALVYLMRLRRKSQPVVDVKKAIWWLERWIARQEETDQSIHKET